MPLLLFGAKEGAKFDAYTAGWTFGKLYYTATPRLGVKQLNSLVSSLRWTKNPFTDEYKLGFEHAYRAQGGNRLPSTVELEEREKRVMGKLGQVLEEVGSFNGYLKADDLEREGVPFCITNIDTRDGQYGKQWELTILVDETAAEIFGMGDTREAKVSVGMNADKPTSRDKVLQKLQGDLPVHNCEFTGTPLKNGKTYYNLSETGPLCPCGYEDEEWKPF